MGEIFGYVILILFSVVMIVPFYWMISSSVKSFDQIITYPPVWIPTQIVWQNFVTIFTQYDFSRYFLNSIIVTIAVTAIVLLSSSLAGFIFAHYKFRGKSIIFLLILSTLMVPFSIKVIPLFLMISFFNWTNTLKALIVPVSISPFGIFLLRQFISSIPRDLFDAARMDGCSELGIYARIVLPNIKSALAALAIFTFINCWDSFLWPLIVTETANCMTLPVGLQFFAQERFTQYNLVMAGSTVAVIPVVIVYLFLQKQFTQGITLTGLKT